MWELRSNLSGYDAAYVAAAELLGVPLVCGDRRLASAPGLRCRVVVPT
jgi:predicted nucleic acid-binding protein